MKGQCFFQFGTSYPLYRYEIVHITIQKENGKKKAFSFAQSLEMRIGILFFFFFSRKRIARGGQEETKRFTKSQSAKGCIILQIFWIFNHLVQL